MYKIALSLVINEEALRESVGVLENAYDEVLKTKERYSAKHGEQMRFSCPSDLGLKTLWMSG